MDANEAHTNSMPLANAFLVALLCADGQVRRRLVTIPDREDDGDD